MYQEFTGNKRQLELENRVLERWKDQDIFARALERRADAPRFTFYEGPPTANGRPGIHHVLSRSLKDIVCRYFDLAGHRVERKAGWDTHGLPVEVEVEKQLKIHGKAAIAEFGLDAFTRRCIDSVFTYTEDWERLTDRIGYWLDLNDPYVTYHEPYVESVWWALSELYKKDALYQGYKVVWWWPQGGTALSQAEVGLGYREVEDPSVTIKFPWKEDAGFGKPTYFLAWTTTPWTLPSHVTLVVGKDIDYVALDRGDEVVIVAAALADTVPEKDEEVTEVGRFKGAELVGKAYEPPFRFAEPEGGHAFEVIEDDFVSTESGTGIVHMAPGFGEDDFRICRDHGMGFLQLVEPDGTMSPAVTPWAGQYIKDADKGITRDLKERGLLFRQGRYKHEYPFCWRAAEDPLIQYARRSWFVRTTSVKDRMLELNADVHWHPEHLREGRFGDFLRNNVDWALSRERFWGTPLPIWVNDETGERDVVGSVEDILQRNPEAFAAFEKAKEADPELSDHLRVHKPWIDDVTWTKDGEPGVYRRVPDVIDCWFDSGAMPFAQRHYPFENEDLFGVTKQADFICEGLDQTRGWFYSLLAISTLLFDRAPYKHVMVNGLVRDRDGKKMSKSLGNTLDPFEVVEAHGADPLRWYIVASSPPWLPKNFDLEGVREIDRKVFGTLWPSYNFFALYAGIDNWKPGSEVAPVADRPAMDRWLLSRTHSVLRDYRAAMERYDPLQAVRLLGRFLVDEVSNWYIRRNRARFWKSTDQADKNAAYDTLYEALKTISFLLAPVAPMSADALYLALHPEGDHLDSIHLGDMPEVDESMIDERLEGWMEAVLEVSGLARAARESASLRVRQPLSRLIVSGPDRSVLSGLLDEELSREVKDELNVKELLVVSGSGEYCTVSLKPNLPRLGPRLGKKLGKLRGILQDLPEDKLQGFESTGTLEIEIDGETVTLDREDVLVEHQGREGFAVAAANGYLAALDTQLDDELVREGLAREFINRVQNQRKQAGLEVTQRIELYTKGADKMMDAVEAHQQHISSEVLASRVTVEREDVDLPGTGQSWKIDEHVVTISLVPREI